MVKMNYGPRFGQHGAGGFKYNDRTDREMRDVAQHMGSIWHNLPQYKKDAVYHERKVKHRKRKAALGTERHDAEVRMVEAVHKCVEILEHHMIDMMQHRPIPGERALINQIGVHNVIYQLRQKCGVGVKFDHASEYDTLLHYEGEHSRGPNPTSEERAEAIVAGMKEQKAARDRRYREIADRLIARGKQNV